MNIHFNSWNWFELLAFIVGLFYFNKLKKSPLQYFVIFLGFIVVAEIVGKYFKAAGQNTINANWYGLFVLPITFITYYWLFAKKQNKFNGFKISSGILLASLLAEQIFFRENKYYFSSISYIIGTILLLLTILNYFLQLLKSNEVLQFKKDPYFWISLGILIFYLPTFPFYGFINYLFKFKRDYYDSYYNFAMNLNCMMYVCFAISFIWKNKT